MARHIDPDKPLSDEDRQWLTDWGRFAQIKEHDLRHGVESAPQPNGLLDALKGPQSGSDASGEQEEPENPLKGEPDSPGAQAPSGAPEGEEVDYEEMTVEELKEELGARELSKSGNKQELIERLQEDDDADE